MCWGQTEQEGLGWDVGRPRTHPGAGGAGDGQKAMCRLHGRLSETRVFQTPAHMAAQKVGVCGPS